MSPREIHIDMRYMSTDTSIRVGSDEKMHIWPTRRHVDGTVVVLSTMQTIQLIDGQAVIYLEPTSVDWCYKIKEPLGGITRFVSVEPGETPMNYTDLQDVDVKTFKPSEARVPAWEAVTAQARILQEEARILVPLIQSTLQTIADVRTEIAQFRSEYE